MARCDAGRSKQGDGYATPSENGGRLGIPRLIYRGVDWGSFLQTKKRIMAYGEMNGSKAFAFLYITALG
jgi:hypothetical protein